MKELLKKLSLIFGPSGYEDKVRDEIKKEISPYLDENTEIINDALGNLLVHIKNDGKPRLAISAHMDEIGFMVSGIMDDGSLKFGCVGGINALGLSAKRVVSENSIYGVITSKPVHLLNDDEKKTVIPIKDMYIDIGADSKEEASKLVSIGDYFTFDSDFVEFGEGFIKCKALDDRLGCAIMCQAIKEFQKSKKISQFDLWFCFTCREEVGYSAARTMSEFVKPDYALVIESKAALDICGVDEDKMVCSLGDGGVISYADRRTILDRKFTQYLEDTCKRNDIKYQYNKYIAGGNDAGAIQDGAGGARVALLSAPSRYIHSNADVINYSDFENMYRAVFSLITEESPVVKEEI